MAALPWGRMKKSFVFLSAHNDCIQPHFCTRPLGKSKVGLFEFRLIFRLVTLIQLLSEITIFVSFLFLSLLGH